MHDAFRHVTAWVFDLDNTLYPPAARLFDQIEVRMTDWVMQALSVDRAEADRLRTHYWQTYGTTLAGLMREHGTDPAPYLTHVHDISLRSADPRPRRSPPPSRHFPGRKLVYTNGSRSHAERVTAARGLTGVFDGSIRHRRGRVPAQTRARRVPGDLRPRRHRPAARAAMFEDDAKNLREPHAIGMRTVHVHPEARPGPAYPLPHRPTSAQLLSSAGSDDIPAIRH